MEAKSIKKISDAELTEAALSYARNIIRVVEEKGQQHQGLLDSLDKVYDVQILVMKPNDSGLRAVERQIIDAYATANVSASLSDNLQRMGSDSLLYTKPIVAKNQKEIFRFTKAIAIRIHKKAIILSIRK